TAIPNKKDMELHHWLDELSLDEFNLLAEKYLSVIPNDIGVIAPSGKNTPKFSESKIRDWINEIIKEGTKPYVERETPKSLLSDDEKEKLQVNEFIHEKNGITGAQELILDNGVKVV